MIGANAAGRTCCVRGAWHPVGRQQRGFEAKEPGNFGDPAGWSQTGLGAGAAEVILCTVCRRHDFASAKRLLQQDHARARVEQRPICHDTWPDEMPQ